MRFKSLLRKIIGNKVPVTTPKLSQLERLKLQGLVVGKNFNMLSGVIIDPSHSWHIAIGDNVTLAPKVHILAHDASTKIHLGYTRIGKVVIGNNVFIGASSIILPGVSIGDNCIIGAGSVVTKSIAEGTVVAGNPAKFICETSDFIEKRKSEMKSVPVYSEAFTIEKNITPEMIRQMTNEMKGGFGYVV